MQIHIDKHIYNLFFTRRKYLCKVISRSNNAIYTTLNNCRIITLFRCQTRPVPKRSEWYGAPHRYAQLVNPNPVTAIFPDKFPKFFIENDEFYVSNGKLYTVGACHGMPLQHKIHKTKNIKSIKWRKIDPRFRGDDNFIKSYLKTQKKSGIPSFFEGRSLEKISVLMRKLKKYFNENKSDKFFDALCKIAGAGPGLTPSTDDFICGVISVLKIFIQSGKLKWKIPFLKIARQSLKQTTKISWYYIVLSMMGYCADWQHDVLKAIKRLSNKARASGTLARERSPLPNIHHGHTSGNDWLYGAHFGVETFIENQ